MMGLMAQRVFDAEETARSTLSERQVLSSSARPAKVEKRQITRNRTSYSCQNCRKRKIKCDKVHPSCGACVKSNDECIYGKGDVDNEEAKGVTGQNGHMSTEPPFNNPPEHSTSQNLATASQLEHLSALEGQLARLTSMVESLRKDSSASAANGLQTPSSSQSPRTEQARSSHDESTAQVELELISRRDAAVLNRPMSELEITKQSIGHIGQARDVFWESISAELDQLQNLLRGPLSNTPEACIDDDVCNVEPKPESFRSLSENDARVPVGFHQAVPGYHRLQPTVNCQICQQTSADKSIFLQGANSLQVRAMSKLDLTDGVPSEAQSNALFRAWLTGVYPILPFMALRQIVRKHHTFWEWKRQYEYDPTNMTESADIYFMPILGCIWYCGVLAMSTKGVQSWFPDRSRAELAAHYHDQVVRYMAFLSFPNNVKLSLMGALMTLEFIPSAEQDPLQSSSYVNLIVRLAQSVGINRESRHVGGTSYDAELRRRMWTHILKLDTSLSVSSGMPSSIDDNLADTLPISEVKDYIVGTEAQKKYVDDIKSGREKIGAVDDPYGDNRSIVSVYHLVSKASSIVDGTLRKILRVHMSPSQITREVLTEMNTIINVAEQSVKDTISNIPTKGVPELGFEPEAGSTPVYDCDPVLGSSVEEAELSNYLGIEPAVLPSNLTRYHRQKLCAFHKWARISLSLMCDKMHCIAYAPFLKNSQSKLWTAARQCALHHSSSFLRKFVCLANDPLLAPFRWSWPAMYQPLHAAIIILVDVYERPFSIEAPRNRSWIDKMFALASPNNGIIGGLNGPSTQRPLHDGGADAWDQLRGLRASGWRKAGLDPEVLWTEEDQILVGVANPLTEEQRVAQALREDLLYADNPKPHAEFFKSTTTLKGIQRLLDLGAEAARRANILECALSDQAAQVFAKMKPSPNRIVKLEGQQRMPFPLSQDVAHRCTKAESEHDPSAARHPSPNAETIFIKDLVKVVQDYAEKRSRLNEGNAYFDPTIENGYDGRYKVPDVENMVTPHITAYTKRSDDPSKRVFNGIVPNGLQIDYSIVQEPLPETPVTSSEPPVETTASIGASPDSFDWDKWDAVFGQYGGFTDLMEDIQWEDPDHA